ncbi:arginine transporter [Rubellimicrobium aerolatum]|uniref:Arginine transporter n=1 Tax=Rubellimicrobium aerolatum TaxID=490979 RepID=A0ABW0SDN6_9RHOB|nr:arginine transporter [Rubellimicrobium aerolatum]
MIGRRFGLGVALGALVVLGSCGGRVSGDIGRACMAGGRDAASARLCSCVQGVANQSLSGSDQKRAAQFFTEPDAAQQVRTSDRPGDEAFWERYRAFADRAAAICG